MAKSVVLAFLFAKQSSGQAPLNMGVAYGHGPLGYHSSERNPLAPGPPGYEFPRQVTFQMPADYQLEEEQWAQEPWVQAPPNYQPPEQEIFVPMPQQPPEHQQLAQVPRQPQPQPNQQQPEDDDVPLIRADILKQRDLFLKQSQTNIDTEIERVTADMLAARAAFLAESEQVKKQYLDHLEQDAQQRLQELDVRHAAKVQEIETASRDYAERLQQWARALVAKSLHQELARAHADKITHIDREESWAKDEMEHQIRAAYDAARLPSSVFADPEPTIQAARSRFDGQMRELAAKRGDIDKDLVWQMREADASIAGLL